MKKTAYKGKYIGVPSPVQDAWDKVCGKTQFADDLPFANMLWGKVLHSPFAHARIVKIDASKALALPGVQAVISYKDSPKTPYNRIMRWAKDGLPATELALDSTVRFVGDKVAAVAAETEEIAQKALKLIDVEYEELPAVFCPEKALEKGATKLYPKGNLLHRLDSSCGDVKKAFSNADFVVKNSLATQIIHHGAIEPHVCIARWANEDELHVWEPQQGVHRVQIMLGKIFGLPYSKIHVHSPAIGGTFGGKDGILLQPIALLLSKKAGGRPVKIRYNRTESMQSTYTRHAINLYGKMGVDKGGKISAFSIHSYMSAGPYCGGSINVQNAMCGKMFKVYNVPNMLFSGRAAYTNTPVGGAMRGFGSPKIFAALELLVNQAAAAVGMDPAEFRLKNLVEAHSQDPISKISLGSARAKECLQQGVNAFAWHKKMANRAKKCTKTYAYGYGLATAMHGNGVAPFSPDITVAELFLNEDGSLHLRTGLTDHGAGTYTLEKQIVCEVLQVSPQKVFVSLPSTDNCPYDMGSGASRNTWSGGAAVQAVAKQMKATTRAVAAEMLCSAEEELLFKNGAYYCPKSKKAANFADIACHAYEKQNRKLAELISHCANTNAGSYGAHFAAVRVNKLTGQVDVLDYLAVCDVGSPLNPLLLEGQVEGAILMGLGMALFEGLELDEKGRAKNANLKKYTLPKASHMPNIRVMFVDNFEEGGPFGGKSIGEASIVPVVPAIVAAVNCALNTNFETLPLNPARVLAAINNT